MCYLHFKQIVIVLVDLDLAKMLRLLLDMFGQKPKYCEMVQE